MHLAGHAVRHHPCRDGVRIEKGMIDNRARRIHVPAHSGRAHAHSYRRKHHGVSAVFYSTVSGLLRESYYCSTVFFDDGHGLIDEGADAVAGRVRHRSAIQAKPLRPLPASSTCTEAL